MPPSTKPTSPLLQRLIDDELDRAALLAQQLLGAEVDAAAVTHGAAAPDDRRLLSSLQRALATDRREAVAAFVASLREQVAASGAQRSSAAPAPRAATLSLVGEDEVAADVAVSRAIEAIDSVAEYELREFASYIAALVGDVDMAERTNPLGAGVYARALWAAVRVLPLTHDHQLALMKQLTMPLAQLLRQAYSAASTRLDDQGVEPAAYRTIILPPGTRRARPRDTEPTDLNQLRDSMPVPLDALPTAAQPLETARSRIDRQLIELLTRLFDAVLRDAQLPPPVQVLLSRLQASAMRVALGDAAMLDDYGHPVWRFMDRLAFDAEVLLADAAGGERLVRYAQRLVDEMVRQPRQDAALYRWGLQRLHVFEQHALQQRIADAAAQIAALDAAEAQLPAPDAPSALDIGTLDTVPADLMTHDETDARARAGDASRWLGARADGELLTLFLQGRWTTVQLLARGARGEVWLLHELPAGPGWAVRRSALQRLRAEGLVEPCDPRSLAQAAADAVLRDVAAPAGGQG